MYYYRKPSCSLALWAAGTLMAFSHAAFTSAFLLHEQNASGLGEFYAGAGAIAEEASTNYYNPAALVLLPGTQMSLSGVNVMTSFTFDGSTQYQSNLNLPPLPPNGLYSASGDASGGTERLVPALHISHRFTNDLAVGFSATAPFGLATSYDEESLVRYQAIHSELKTLNLGPSIAYKVVPWLALGVGFDAQYSKVEVTSAVNLDPFVATPSPASDGISKNNADSWGWGWHAGALAIIDSKSRVGLNVRSNMEHHYTGDSVYNEHDAHSHVSGEIDLPWWADLSGVHAFDDKWTVLGSVSYIHWSSVSKLELEDVSVVVPVFGGIPEEITSTDALNFKNSWSVFTGLRYQANQTFLLKGGLGFDQTPTNDEDRDLRLPDEDRWIASVGLRITPPQAKKVSLDVAYAHIFSPDADIDKSLAGVDNPVNSADGKVTAHADLIGAQLTLRL